QISHADEVIEWRFCLLRYSSAGTPKSNGWGLISISLPLRAPREVYVRDPRTCQSFSYANRVPLEFYRPMHRPPCARASAYDPIRGVQGHFDIQPSLVRDGG